MESSVRLHPALKLFWVQLLEHTTSAGHLSSFYIVGGWQAGSLAPPGAHAAGLVPFGVDEACAASAAADVPACRYMEPDAA